MSTSANKRTSVFGPIEMVNYECAYMNNEYETGIRNNRHEKYDLERKMINCVYEFIIFHKWQLFFRYFLLLTCIRLALIVLHFIHSLFSLSLVRWQCVYAQRMYTFHRERESVAVIYCVCLCVFFSVSIRMLYLLFFYMNVLFFSFAAPLFHLVHFFITYAF